MPRTLRWEPPSTPFTLEHVVPLGVTQRILEHAVRTDRVRRLVRGVYVNTRAVPETPEGRHLQLALARQLLRPRLIAGDATAALAWGLELDDPSGAARGPTSFLRPPGAGARSERGVDQRVRVAAVPREQRAAHPSGLVVTTVPRVAVDVAAGLDLPAALITVDAAARMLLQERVGLARIRAQQQDRHAIAAALAPLRAAVQGATTHLTRRGVETALAWADPRRESAAESLSYGHMVIAGLPLPELQVPLHDEQGVMYPDFRWHFAMLVGEVDGNVKYQSPEDLVAERRRQARIERLGYRVVRWEAAEIRHRPGAVMRRLAGALESGSGLAPAP
ncbi:MAG TPA: hypothetical protein VF143_12035 [Candidatus Nanopelagicales bacterium]